jgi:TetR/AcrR family transcriptional regulator
MDNQTHLLDCALALFSQNSYAAVGVQEVVEAAGLTKPTLYHYFGSKRGLLDALLAREAEPLLAAMTAAAVYQGDLVQTLENITRAFFNSAQNAPDFYRMFLSMQYSPPESETYCAIAPYVRGQQHALEAVFQKAAEDYGNMIGRKTRYAAGFQGAINAAIGLYFQGEWDLDSQAVYQVVHQFMHGIFS